MSVSRSSSYFEDDSATLSLHKSRERRLFHAVLLQALKDSVSTNKSAEERAARVHARVWLTRSNQGFREVCELAGLNPTKVLEQAKALEAKGWPPNPFGLAAIERHARRKRGLPAKAKHHDKSRKNGYAWSRAA